MADNDAVVIKSTFLPQPANSTNSGILQSTFGTLKGIANEPGALFAVCLYSFTVRPASKYFCQEKFI